MFNASTWLRKSKAHRHPSSAPAAQWPQTAHSITPAPSHFLVSIFVSNSLPISHGYRSRNLCLVRAPHSFLMPLHTTPFRLSLPKFSSLLPQVQRRSVRTTSAFLKMCKRLYFVLTIEWLKLVTENQANNLLSLALWRFIPLWSGLYCYSLDTCQVSLLNLGSNCSLKLLLRCRFSLWELPLDRGWALLSYPLCSSSLCTTSLCVRNLTSSDLFSGSQLSLRCIYFAI